MTLFDIKKIVLTVFFVLGGYAVPVFCSTFADLAEADSLDESEEVADSTAQTVSQLTMPNAFSPNGDGHNDTYKPKAAQNIVEFRAIIFNRWGQKLYEWDDVDGEGWDGTFGGKRVKDGVYFINVRARGADGQTYTIKKDVNVLTEIPLEDSTVY